MPSLSRIWYDLRPDSFTASSYIRLHYLTPYVDVFP
jgi:hypothetical protein